MLEEQLEKFGLSEKEAKIYLSLLELGETTATDLANHTKINRSSTYVVLDNLENKGLLSSLQDAGIQRYKAAPPEKITQLAEDSLKKQQEIADMTKSILPDLKAMNSEHKYRPNVKVYEGIEGLREVYYSILNVEADELLVYADGHALVKLLPEFVDKNIERAKKGIPMRAINPYSKINEIMLKRKLYKGDQFLLVPKENFNFDSDLAVYGNFVAFTSRSEELGILIESKHMADAMRGHFNLVWEGSKIMGKLIKH